MTHQTLPSGTTDADEAARTLARLIGPQIRPADGTLVAEDLRVQGQMLAEARGTVVRAVAQAHPGTATDLLPELEDEYGLTVGTALPVADRQRRLLAKARARADGSLPALARTARTVFPAAALATISAPSVASTLPAAVFNTVILVSRADLEAVDRLRQLDALLGQQLTGHASWTYGRGAGPDLEDFLCDDPESLVEIDLLSE